jgi:hypothetical protein
MNKDIIQEDNKKRNMLYSLYELRSVLKDIEFKLSTDDFKKDWIKNFSDIDFIELKKSLKRDLLKMEGDLL